MDDLLYPHTAPFVLWSGYKLSRMHGWKRKYLAKSGENAIGRNVMSVTFSQYVHYIATSMSLD
jgi:hypothetical protein